MTSLLQVTGLSIEGRINSSVWKKIVDNVTLQIERGEVVAFIGESGAGKTTLALSALGYMRPGTRISGGTVTFAGTNVLDLSAIHKRFYRGKEVAYVAQSAAAALNPSIRIGNQIAEGLLIHKLATPLQAQERVLQLLRLMQIFHPEVACSRYPQQMSGGQQQRIMTSIAMACAPKLLVLDEPTTALDVTTQIEVLNAIRIAIQTEKAAAIYVSHDLPVVAQIASRIIVLRGGRIVEEGSTDQIVNFPRHEYTRALLSAVKQVPRLVAGASFGVQGKERAVLCAEDITATYSKGRRVPSSAFVLQDISVQVNSGEIFALVGESGSGKSTLARVFAGLHQPVKGAVSLSGEKLAGKSGNRTKEQLRRIQIVFQSPEQALNPKIRVGKAIGRTLHFYFALSKSEARQRVAELLKMVGLPADFASRYPSELSGGQRQRVAIARAFGAAPDVILCDEFLSALDTVVATRIQKLMSDLRKSHGVAYVFISHDLATVASIADRVSVMYAGRIVETGTPAQIFFGPHHPYTNLLVRSIPELRTDWLEAVNINRGLATDNGDARAPSPVGCPFSTRCPIVILGKCSTQIPPARLSEDGHKVVCHHDAEILRQQTIPIRWLNEVMPGLDEAVSAQGTTVRKASG